MLVAGVRATHDLVVSNGGIKPEGFVKLDTEIGRQVRAVAEITANAREIAGVAGIKVTW
jgi:hypothetical protein